MKKKVKKCQYEGCILPSRPGDCYCNFHDRKATISRFLGRVYNTMKRRVNGKNTNRPDLYIGKPILPREAFFNWSKNHPEFLRLYKVWVNCDFDRRFTPSVNRIVSTKGYVFGNIEWMTNSNNCGLAGAVKHLNHKKEIYRLLGVTK
jgi:hypothetical protein